MQINNIEHSLSSEPPVSNLIFKMNMSEPLGMD